MLHLTGVKAVNPKYETLGEPPVPRRPQAVPPAGQQVPRSSRSTGGRPVWRPPPARSARVRHQRGHGHGLDVARHFNRPGFELFDFDVYALAGDGCMMEGVARRRPRWPGTCNSTTSAGSTTTTRSRSRAAPRSPSARTSPRFAASDGTSCASRMPTTGGCWPRLPAFRATTGRRSSSCERIGYGAPTSRAPRSARRTARGGGSPPREAELRVARGRAVPRAGRGARAFRSRHRSSRPARSARTARLSTPMPRNTPTWPTICSGCSAASCPTAGTRDPDVPGRCQGHGRTRSDEGAQRDCRSGAVDDGRLGRSDPIDQDPADLRRRRRLPAASRAGRNLHFGVREHAAGGIANGLALSKVAPLRPVSDLLATSSAGPALSRPHGAPGRPPLTHDSIGVGEDGPTHQPVEQLASLRAIPGLVDIRPSRRQRGRRALRMIMPMWHDPVALILSRQALPPLDRSRHAPSAEAGPRCLRSCPTRRDGR